MGPPGRDDGRHLPPSRSLPLYTVAGMILCMHRAFVPVLSAPLGGAYFTDGETEVHEAKSLVGSHTTCKGQKEGSHPAKLTLPF